MLMTGMCQPLEHGLNNGGVYSMMINTFKFILLVFLIVPSLAGAVTDDQ